MKNLQDKTVATTAKQAYIKPTMEVYEIEIEGALLQSSADPDGYQYDNDGWSKADINGTDITNQSFNA